MKETIKNTVIRSYGELCRKLKVGNWQNNVFMSNSIEIVVAQQKKLDGLEKSVIALEKQMDELRSTVSGIKVIKK
jgi:cell division protein FtsB